MLRTLDRYVIREILPPFLLSLLVFTFVLEIPPVMRQLETLVGKGVAWTTAARMMALLVPQALGLTIPMALLTGLLIGLGRLSADRESVALLACGVSPYRLLRPILIFAVLATLATGYVMIEAIPNANQRFREILFEIISKRVENDIKPRVFFEDFPGWVLYARDEAAGGGWKDVMVADTHKPEAADLYLAASGRLVLTKTEKRVELVLTNGTRYSTSRKGEMDTFRFPTDLIMGLDPQTVFGRMELPRGVTEKTIAQLKETIAQKRAANVSPHQEIMAMHAKFSIPVACLVFALIGLALGVTVARDGKLAGFVIGVAVIFVYYALMYLPEAMTKGHWMNPAIARWVPNIVLGPAGIAALIWRARFAERGLFARLPLALPYLPGRRRRAPTGAAAPAARPARPQVVLRIPRLRAPGPGILDRYISTMYLRVTGLSFLGLLGLFYISTFIERAERLFKGTATAGTLLQLLLYMTPQFVLYVIPLAALVSVLVTYGVLSRTSELTVMKACGVSLYRLAVPVVAISLVWSVAIFTLDQHFLAASNRLATALDDRIKNRPPRTINPLNRQWIIGRDGSIYHYGSFDPGQTAFTNLSIYRPAAASWVLQSHTYASRVRFESGNWVGRDGWTADVSSGKPAWQAFTSLPLTLENPDYFETEQADAEAMSVQELRRYTQELAASGVNAVPLMVELQKKIAFPFVTLVMTLLAVPFGVSTGRRGTLYGVGLGIVIALIYWLLLSVFVAIGRAGMLPPWLAAWTPNIIVAAAAGYLFLTVKT